MAVVEVTSIQGFFCYDKSAHPMRKYRFSTDTLLKTGQNIVAYVTCGVFKLRMSEALYFLLKKYSLDISEDIFLLKTAVRIVGDHAYQYIKKTMAT